MRIVNKSDEYLEIKYTCPMCKEIVSTDLAPGETYIKLFTDAVEFEIKIFYTQRTKLVEIP